MGLGRGSLGELASTSYVSTELCHLQRWSGPVCSRLAGVLIDGSTLGDEFVRVKASATDLQQRILDAGDDDIIYADPSNLEGVNVWVLNWIATLGQINVRVAPRSARPHTA